jgi:PhnB protein
MARVSTYLNFAGDAEEAFTFYAEVFGTGPLGHIMRMGDLPVDEGAAPMSDAQRQLVAHVELPILAGHVIMATDMEGEGGHRLRIGNNTTINLEPDTKEEADRLFLALSEGATERFEMTDMPWGSYWGTCLDRFGVRWMFNVVS